MRKLRLFLSDEKSLLIRKQGKSCGSMHSMLPLCQSMSETSDQDLGQEGDRPAFHRGFYLIFRKESPGLQIDPKMEKL